MQQAEEISTIPISQMMKEAPFCFQLPELQRYSQLTCEGHVPINCPLRQQLKAIILEHEQKCVFKKH